MTYDSECVVVTRTNRAMARLTRSGVTDPARFIPAEALEPPFGNGQLDALLGPGVRRPIGLRTGTSNT